MKPLLKFRHAQQGSSLIEVLVTLLILLLGLLGLVGLMLQSQRAQMESYQRVQALVILQDMVNRINANRKAAPCYAITTASDGTPSMGTGSGTPVCALPFDVALETADEKLLREGRQTRAIADMVAWNALLKGSNEKSGTSDVGAMLNARGCVTAATVGTTIVYTVSVVWQGKGKTVAPTVNCGNGLYDATGDGDAQRRAVSVPLQIAALS